MKKLLTLGLITGLFANVSLSATVTNVAENTNKTENLSKEKDFGIKFDFKKRVALVTGGTSGIGLATAQLLVKSNCNVVIVGHDPKKANVADKITKEYAKNGVKCLYFKADVADPKDAKKAVEFTVQKFGSLDFLVCSAGIGGDNNTIDKETPENFNKVMNVDLNGTVWFNKYATEQMLKQGNGGAIVNVSSMFGIVAVPENVAYSTAKGAINNLTRAGVKYADKGIRVNCVCPGVIDTPLVPNEAKDFYAGLHPIKRIGSPDETAYPIVFLLSDASSFITGAIISIDGGYIAV